MELREFKQIVMPLREKLQGFARNMLSNEFEAEDAVQEAFLKLWNARQQLENHPNIGGFAMQTLKNVCIDKLRSERNKTSIDSIKCHDNGINPLEYTEQKDSINIIKNIISHLPNTQRIIITMRDIEGYELNEIAEIIGSDSSAIRVNLSRARKSVRDTFIGLNNK